MPSEKQPPATLRSLWRSLARTGPMPQSSPRCWPCPMTPTTCTAWLRSSASMWVGEGSWEREEKVGRTNWGNMERGACTGCEESVSGLWKVKDRPCLAWCDLGFSGWSEELALLGNWIKNAAERSQHKPSSKTANFLNKKCSSDPSCTGPLIYLHGSSFARCCQRSVGRKSPPSTCFPRYCGWPEMQ